MNRELLNLGSRLKQEREHRALSIAEIARITKIPERSLERLEAGEFEQLPGDVFVRGFLRSYARCVGLDPEDTVRTYGEASGRIDKVRHAPAPAAAVPAATAAPATVVAAAAEKAEPATPDPGLVAKALADVGFGTKRISLTLAVIILVIVATLTLSLLLRRPTHVGTGVSFAPRAAEAHG